MIDFGQPCNQFDFMQFGLRLPLACNKFVFNAHGFSLGLIKHRLKETSLLMKIYRMIRTMQFGFDKASFEGDLNVRENI